MEWQEINLQNNRRIYPGIESTTGSQCKILKGLLTGSKGGAAEWQRRGIADSPNKIRD